MKTEKIINWCKQNWILIGIIVFALVIRIYYFILTQGQVLWWDEAEYLNMAKRFAFGIDYAFGPVRPVLFSFITAIFLKIANTEFLPRLLILLLSMASVVGMYYFGKELYNKKVGLLSSFLMSIFYLNLFFTYRLLVDIPSLTFFIFSSFFLYKYFKTNSKKALYLAAVMIAVGTLFKLSTAFILVACLIYLLITEGFKFLKRKEIWIASLIFLLILAPYLIWGYFEFGGFVLTQASGHVAPESYFAGFNIFKNYLISFPTYFSWPLLITFIFGLALMYKLFLYFDLLVKGDKKLKRDLYLLLTFLIPLILISILIGHNENRYIMTIFPTVFVISSSFIIYIYDYIKKNSKLFAIILLVLLLGFTTFYQFQSTDSLIKDKEDSYLPVKVAGIWLKENTNTLDLIATKSRPQINYYSERQTIWLPETELEFESLLSPNVKFYMLSTFENHPEWAYSYPERKNLTAVQLYRIEDGQVILIIYEFPETFKYN